MTSYSTCSWCHTLVAIVGGTGTRDCPTCGHRADLARLDCDCPTCRRYELPPHLIGEPNAGNYAAKKSTDRK